MKWACRLFQSLGMQSRDAEGYMGISLGYIVMAKTRKLLLEFWLGCLGRWRGMR